MNSIFRTWKRVLRVVREVKFNICTAQVYFDQGKWEWISDLASQRTAPTHPFCALQPCGFLFCGILNQLCAHLKLNYWEICSISCIPCIFTVIRIVSFQGAPYRRLQNVARQGVCYAISTRRSTMLFDTASVFMTKIELKLTTSSNYLQILWVGLGRATVLHSEIVLALLLHRGRIVRVGSYKSLNVLGEH